MFFRLIIVSILLTVLACSKTETPIPIDTNWVPTSIDGQFVFNTFKSVGLGGSRGKVQKWAKSEVLYWYDTESTPTNALIPMSDSVFAQINQYTQSTEFVFCFKISITPRIKFNICFRFVGSFYKLS